MQITIYTDGACDIHAPNQPGGWAAILCATDESGSVIKESVLRGGREMTTNNQMELTAVIEGLNALKRLSQVTVVSDSQYVINIANRTKKSRKNADLWKRYFELAARHQIKWLYIEGHSGHPYNERCDRIAVAEKNRLSHPKANSVDQPPLAIESDIQVYLSTRYSSQRKKAAWSAVTVSEQEVREYGASLENTSELEALLIGANTCLAALPNDRSVTVLTAQEYLSKGMNHWIAKWAAKGWKTQAGKPVKYQSHWRDLLKLSKARKLAFVFVRSRQDNPHFQRGMDMAKQLLEGAD